MQEFTPSTPISIQIRKIIFEKFNDPELRFTNDEIFKIIQENKDVDPSWNIVNIEQFFLEICDKGLTRNIAQDLTTLHFKLFDTVEKLQCNTCNREIYLGGSEDKICPYQECKAKI